MRTFLAAVGKNVAIAYGVFLVVAMFVSLNATDGRGTVLVLFATASIAVPYFWKHKFAPLAFAVPFLFTIYGLWPLYQQHRAQQQAIEAMVREFGQMGGPTAEQMGGSIGGPLDSLGIGAWIQFATVIYLAFRGVMRFLSRS